MAARAAADQAAGRDAAQAKKREELPPLPPREPPPPLKDGESIRILFIAANPSDWQGSGARGWS